MSPGWQIIDAAVRLLRMALRSADFQKTPAVVAVITHTAETLTELLSHYTSSKAGIPTGVSASAPSSEEMGHLESSEADDEPGGS